MRLAPARGSKSHGAIADPAAARSCQSVRVSRGASTTLAERVRRVTGARAFEAEQRLQRLWGGYGDLWRGQLFTKRETVGVIVKDVKPPSDDGSLSHRRKLRSYRVEQSFYQRYAARCGEACKVPRSLGHSAESGGLLMVLEDLDESGFVGRARWHAGSSDEQRSSVLAWLAAFHATFLGQPPEGLWSTGTYWHLATRPDELRRMQPGPLRDAAQAIDARLAAARFRTLVHGDAKPENMCFAADARVALVDFQYVGGGAGIKDVAYFLNSSLQPRQCAALVPRCLDEYFVALGDALAARLPRDELAALELEWRELFSFAWADFQRFLRGWAPDELAQDPFSDELIEQVLRALR